MRRVIYSCDKCDFETEDISKIYWLKIEDEKNNFGYIKMLCADCVNEIKGLIDNKFMIIDSDELRR